MSTHQIEVVEIKMEPHPNADKLAIVRPFGYIVCVNKEQWKDGDLAAYVPPDYVVDITKPEFSFLERPRVKVKKLRGVMSQGLLVPAPPGSKLGDNVIDILGIKRYNPQDPISTRGDSIAGPDLLSHKYDIDDYRRYGKVMFKDQTVLVTEKIHGANARFVMTSDGKIWCGSRSEWKKEDKNNLWWKCLEQNPTLKDLINVHRDHIFYGEVYGQVQDLKYGAEQNQIFFKCFDVLYNGQWKEVDWLLEHMFGKNILVPILYLGPHDKDLVEQLAEGESTILGAKHMREGCVVRAVPEETHPRLGRVQLKIVGNGYLERS